MDHLANALNDHQRALLLSDPELVAKHSDNLLAWEEDILRRKLTSKLGLPWLDVDAMMVDQPAFAEERGACRDIGFLTSYRGPISRHVFMAEPFNHAAIRRLRNLYHCEIHPIGTSRRALERTLTWLEQRIAPTIRSAAAKPALNTELTSWCYRPEEGIKFIHRILLQAHQRSASDVFFETCADRLDIRFKRGGRCEVMPPIRKEHTHAVLRDAKAFASMNTRETRGYRDGSGEFVTLDGTLVNVRAVAQKTLSGESLTLRILDKTAVTHQATALPFPPQLASRVANLLRLRQGLIVVCGPTGSGKTTTLWRCLHSLDSSEKKIVTIEDPVEYRFDRFVQMPVKGKTNDSTDELPETFAAALRSCLRAAPDVILVGEMRDGETAKVAVEASLTGHLILTTTHTPDAPGVLPRLFDLGVSALNLRQTLLAVIAQRLVRTLCPQCRIPVAPTAAQKRHYQCYQMPLPAALFSPGACPTCAMTGVTGLTVVFEVLIVTPELRHRIQNSFDEVDFRRSWLANGGQSLGMHALELASTGAIAYEDAFELDSVAATTAPSVNVSPAN